MKNLLLLCIALLIVIQGRAQSVRRITDQHIVNQQERMVFKQWDKKKFTPTKGFLGLNPNYWLTWAWHPNYPKKDRRPLSGNGEQTQRILLVAAMKSTEEAYTKHADTLRNTALIEMLNYVGAISDTDPLWQLYYSAEFQSLYQVNSTSALEGTEAGVKDYLSRTGVLQWFLDESTALLERLQAARSTNLDRGSRIMAYHRMLDEYRKLRSIWETKKQQAKRFLSLAKTVSGQRQHDNTSLDSPGRTDVQIADDVLRKSKL
ncbi:hypothetical protein BWD42_06955 [Sphingobacterium sp. CZ-UAM]|uniref:hypothetical protein n=1 Tax=Sphingobacterium sp. CZ-UAM TaxID=1933868 RepID=UPI0009843054|nr:hypothetical protein [Sphingobacterium sp. CZ-UAM]OOG19644.1 hypothetical protein BWD42_06955 [Sphingobacterium sp. CZ-UAM]